MDGPGTRGRSYSVTFKLASSFRGCDSLSVRVLFRVSISVSVSLIFGGGVEASVNVCVRFSVCVIFDVRVEASV